MIYSQIVGKKGRGWLKARSSVSWDAGEKTKPAQGLTRAAYGFVQSRSEPSQRSGL